MSQFSGYIGNTPVPRGTQIITQGTLPLPTDYVVVPGGYSTGSVKLYINGLRINETDYAATNGTTVEFDRTYPAGTEYIVEEVNQFEIPNMNWLTEVSNIDPRRFHIRYTTDLWSATNVDIFKMTLNDVFVSKYYDQTRHMSSGGEWQLVSLVASAPDLIDGLNSDGYLYAKRGATYLKFVLVSNICSPIQFGKGTSLVKNLYMVSGGAHSQPMILGGFWTLGDGGGGTFIWDDSRPKSDHDGGTIIDPGRIKELGVNDTPPAYFIPVASGTGCWIRVYTGSTDPKWFGDFS